jgi:hypothetical protein
MIVKKFSNALKLCAFVFFMLGNLSWFLSIQLFLIEDLLKNTSLSALNILLGFLSSLFFPFLSIICYLFFIGISLLLLISAFITLRENVLKDLEFK